TGERPTAMPDAGLSKRDELTEVVEAFRDALRSCQVKAFTARATIRPNNARATVDCTSIVYLARWVSGITSVGLNAVAFGKPRGRKSRNTGRQPWGASSGLMCWVNAKSAGSGCRARMIGPPLSISQY